MAIFLIIVVFFAGLFLLFVLPRFIGVQRRRQKFSKLLDKVSAVFTEFQYLADITLSLGLFLSVNFDTLVEDVYNKPENLEIARKIGINMWDRGE
jgi:hypothetical protein